LFPPLNAALLVLLDEGTLKAEKLSRDIGETAMEGNELIARILLLDPLLASIKLELLHGALRAKSREHIGITSAKSQCT
jgi:hypothetical protein